MARSSKKIPSDDPDTTYDKAQISIAIFKQKYKPDQPQESIHVNINEVVAYTYLHGITRPGNIHNFFKDIVRNGRLSRRFQEIIDLGYTIVQTDKGGAFVQSNNNELTDVVELAQIEPVDINTQAIPKLALHLVRTDEGGAISVIEYCRILDLVLGSPVYRIQAPVKVQPNEIDGCFVTEKDGQIVLLSIEAKSKGSDVLLKHQIYGAAEQAMKHFGESVNVITPIGAKIADDNTIYIVVFYPYTHASHRPAISETHRFRLIPVPDSWAKKAITEKSPFSYRLLSL